jgi:hypothetical protein
MGLEVKSNQMIRKNKTKQSSFFTSWEEMQFHSSREFMVNSGCKLILPSLSDTRKIAFLSITFRWKVFLFGNVG